MSIKLYNIKFHCDPSKCRSRCCYGNCTGAPLAKGEADIIRSLLPALDLPKENMEICEQWNDDKFTPVYKKGCAFIVGNGCSRRCAIQEAYNKGLTDFIKPISCHLFPLRVSPNGHISFEWRDCCKPAVSKGWSEGIPLLVFLREALVRRFGEERYKEFLCGKSF